jgi:hypothetical protein
MIRKHERGTFEALQLLDADDAHSVAERQHRPGQEIEDAPQSALEERLAGGWRHGRGREV